MVLCVLAYWRWPYVSLLFVCLLLFACLFFVLYCVWLFGYCVIMWILCGYVCVWGFFPCKFFLCVWLYGFMIRVYGMFHYFTIGQHRLVICCLKGHFKSLDLFHNLNFDFMTHIRPVRNVCMLCTVFLIQEMWYKTIRCLSFER